MPADAPYTAENTDGDAVIKVSVEGDLEPNRSVYFTDQSPEYTITVENLTNSPTEGKVVGRLVFDESSRDFDDGFSISCNLDPGEKTEKEYQPDMLSYQGNAAVGVVRCSVRKRDSHYKISKLGSTIERLYTFMVYDREYYKLNYALVKYIVGESENFSNNLSQCFSSRFAKDSSPKLERTEIRCQFVL